MGATLTRRHNREQPQEQPKAKRLTPISNAGDCPECKACIEWRKKLNRQNTTIVYCTRGRVRYCRCLVCAMTWKIVDGE